MKYWLIISFVISVLISGCEEADSSSKSTEITVAAASDLLPAFNEIADLYENEHDGVITYSFGSTGQLADQIENGAPFDVFAAANVSFMDRLVEGNYVFEDSQQTYAFGRIGITSMKEDNYHVDTLKELTSTDIRFVSIANPEHAPYGLAAKEALESAHVYDEIEKKLVLGRNITDALTQIETGNTEVGIIALSLFKSQQDDLSFTLLDEELHQPLEQSIGVVKGTDEEVASREFIDFILNGNGKKVMEKYGFVVPEGKD